MQSMTTTANMDEQQARQLLGTLSRNRDDIRAAYLHHYRACALELSRADTQVQQQQLEAELARLRSAQSVLLADGPAHSMTQKTAADNQDLAADSQHLTAESRQHPTPVTTQVLLSSTLVVLLCAVTLLSAFLWQQGDQLQQLEQQLSQQQQRYQTLSQRAQHQDQLLNQTLQQHDEQQQQWLTHLTQQQRLQQQQQKYIEQQQQLSQTLHQRLASVDRQLSVEHQQTLRLQQQVARLHQQSDVLIDELCQDTASAQPAIDDAMVPAYMNRCRLLWSLASD